MKGILLALTLLLTNYNELLHEPVTIEPEKECFSCNIDFTAQVIACQEECFEQPCEVVLFTITGVYSCSGFYAAADAFFIGNWKDYECGGSGSGTWDPYGPTYTAEINVCEWSDDSGDTGYMYIPVRFDYSYDCGGYTCYDFVYKSIQVVVC